MPKKQTKKSKPTKTNSSDDSPDAGGDLGVSTAGKEAVSIEIPQHGEDIADLVDPDDRSRQLKHPVHVKVSVRQGETIEQMLRRFNFAVNKTDVIQKLKDTQFFEKPSKRRQREEKMRMQQVRRYDK